METRWNYRVIQTEHSNKYTYSIHKVYYIHGKDGDIPIIIMREENPPAEIYRLYKYLHASKYPIIELNKYKKQRNWFLRYMDTIIDSVLGFLYR